MLRPRQVELVGEFMRAAMSGRSRVEQVVNCRCFLQVVQMIMGAGKTTVIVPLLTLLLADGGT